LKLEKINSDNEIVDIASNTKRYMHTYGRSSRSTIRRFYTRVKIVRLVLTYLKQEMAVTLGCEIRHAGRDHRRTYRDLKIARDIRAIPLLSVVTR